jgi:hypothetical protein
MFSDWKFYLFLMAILNTAVTSIAFLTIKFNDLRHLGKDVSGIQNDVKEISCKVNKIDKGLAVQKQRINDLEKSIK